jgi:fructosamine-3-kinase
MKLTDNVLRLPLEQFISRQLGRSWSVTTSRDMADYACHPAAILSDGIYSVFAKYSDAANGLHQFEVELTSLNYLAGRAEVRIPPPLGILPAGLGHILVLEEIRSVERTSRNWRQMGQALACIHKVKADTFGLERNGFFGPLPQDNTPMSDWPSFYAERRLLPALKRAIDSGNLPTSFILPLERIIRRLPDLCGPDVIPTLLHGDAQQNNFISSEVGAYVIDPAIYYGNPEVDLAFIDYFQPVPDDFFAGYQEELPIDSGFWERRPLWRIWGYLAAVAVEGAGYLGQLQEAVEKFG